MLDIIALFILAVLSFFLTFGVNIVSTVNLDKIPISAQPFHNLLNRSNSSPIPTISKTTEKEESPATDRVQFKTRRSPLVEQRRRDSTRSFQDILNKATNEDKELGDVMKNLFPEGFGSPSPKNIKTDSVFEETDPSINNNQ
jgi:hypothetical protein